MSVDNNKKSKFGTLSVVTVFFVTFLVVIVILAFMVFFLSLKLTGTESDGFGGVLLLAILFIPTIVVSAVIAWAASYRLTSSMRSQMMPENYTAKLILRGVYVLVFAWPIGWIIWNIHSSFSSPNIIIPIILSALIQVFAFAGLGLLSKSPDKSRRQIWSLTICIIILITPAIVFKAMAN